MPETSLNTSLRPSSSNHLYYAFWMSIRLGISITSSILPKLILSVLPSFTGLTLTIGVSLLKKSMKRGKRYWKSAHKKLLTQKDFCDNIPLSDKDFCRFSRPLRYISPLWYILLFYIEIINKSREFSDFFRILLTFLYFYRFYFLKRIIFLFGLFFTSKCNTRHGVWF